MKKALIVAAHGELRQAIYEALMNCDFDDVIVTDRVDFAREQISECEIVYINFPLSGNQDALRFLAELTKKPNLSIVALAREISTAALEEALEDTQVFILSKPTTKAVITASVRAARSLTRRIAHAHEVQNQLRTKLEDIKLLNRAKSCLISYLGMTEPQAHRYIQKHAMDARITPREVSEEILKTYEY